MAGMSVAEILPGFNMAVKLQRIVVSLSCFHLKFARVHKSIYRFAFQWSDSETLKKGSIMSKETIKIYTKLLQFQFWHVDLIQKCQYLWDSFPWGHRIASNKKINTNRNNNGTQIFIDRIFLYIIFTMLLLSNSK